MNKKLIERIEELFTSYLSTKTNWGRNEILALHSLAVKTALLEIVDK